MRSILILSLVLAACGGDTSEPVTTPVASCVLPSDQSAFSMACATEAYMQPTWRLTVEVTGRVSGAPLRHVNITINGSAYQARVIDSTGQFRLVQTVTADTFGGPKWLAIGFSSLGLMGDQSALQDVTLKTTADPL